MLIFVKQITKAQMLKYIIMNCSSDFVPNNNKFDIILKNNTSIKKYQC